jgi:hypothetical protein
MKEKSMTDTENQKLVEKYKAWLDASPDENAKEALVYYGIGPHKNSRDFYAFISGYLLAKQEAEKREKQSI